jgi:L-iditol 2-dehydrogenase
MKAALNQGTGKIRLEQVEIPKVPPNYVLIDTKATGICGYDIQRYYGKWPRPKFAAGHELAGNIVEVGDGVSKVNVGDPVCVECFSHCGICTFCQTGHYNLCENRINLSQSGHAGFCEYSLIHESSLFKLPKNMSFEEGALVEPLAVTLRGFFQTKANHRDSIVILGAGTIGLFCLAVAKAAGVVDVIISAKYPQQAEMAERFGANHIIQSTDQDVQEEIQGITEGLGADVVIDTVGSSNAFTDALAIVKPTGMICLIGGYTDRVNVDLAPIVGKELRLVGSNCYGYSGRRKDFDTAIDLIASGTVTPTALVTHKFSLEQIEEAFRVAANKTTGSIKVLITQS